MDYATLLAGKQCGVYICNTKDIESDAINVLLSISTFDYLLQGQPSLFVLEKYALKFFIASFASI